ncbi:MAG: M16 family metallopeptidase, partial [Thermoanaerobaculia bacterium]
HEETLDNGLKVIVVPMPADGLAAYWSIVRTGSRDEVEPGRTGFAHFYEHMMFLGTERFPARTYNQMVTRMGADDNAFTTDDLTAYHLGIAAEDLETVMMLESDRFQNLSYDETAFKTHTYGHTTMGYEEDIKGMPNLFAYSRQFFDRCYRPENVVVLIAGDVEFEPTLALARKYYGAWKPGYHAPEVPAEPPQTGERRIQVKYEGRSLPIAWVAYKAPAFAPTDRGYVAAWLLGDLAFGETSELYKKLVLDEQVVEFVSAELNWNRDPGLFDVLSMVKDPAKVDYVVGEIDKTVARYQETPVDAARLADIKSRTKYGFLMGLDTPDAVAGGLSRLVALTGGIEVVDQMFGTLQQVTPADVQNAARELLRANRRTVAVLRGES